MMRYVNKVFNHSYPSWLEYIHISSINFTHVPHHLTRPVSLYIIYIYTHEERERENGFFPFCKRTECLKGILYF